MQLRAGLPLLPADSRDCPPAPAEAGAAGRGGRGLAGALRRGGGGGGAHAPRHAGCPAPRAPRPSRRSRHGQVPANRAGRCAQSPVCAQSKKVCREGLNEENVLLVCNPCLHFTSW